MAIKKQKKYKPSGMPIPQIQSSGDASTHNFPSVFFKYSKASSFCENFQKIASYMNFLQFCCQMSLLNFLTFRPKALTFVALVAFIISFAVSSSLNSNLKRFFSCQKKNVMWINSKKIWRKTNALWCIKYCSEQKYSNPVILSTNFTFAKFERHDP